MRPLAWLFYGTFTVAALWHAPRTADTLLARFDAATPTTVMDDEEWWREGWSTLPAQRNERDERRRWPLDVQIAGPLDPVRERLQARGWRVQSQADWIATLGLLDDDAAAGDQPVLPATLDAQAETLLMVHPGAREDEEFVLRLWRAPVLLDDGTPLWIGTSQTLRLNKPLAVAALWLPVNDDGRAHALVREALKDLERIEAPHPHGDTPVLRVRTTPAGEASGK
jgi:hypothetical protein